MIKLRVCSFHYREQNIFEGFKKKKNDVLVKKFLTNIYLPAEITHFSRQNIEL